ncbi:unnamed protein product, partial [Adineta steineri]
NSTTGMAFYTLKHRDGEDKTLDLYINEGKIGQFTYIKEDFVLKSDIPIGMTMNYTLQIANYSPWLDYAACIRVLMSSPQQNPWFIQYSISGIDITTIMTSANGFVFVRENRVRPNTVQSINISFTRTSLVSDNMTLIIELAPHRGSAIVDSLKIII